TADAVLLGNGDGTFRPPAPYAVSTAPGTGRGALVAGDFNGDGRLDLTVASTIIDDNGDYTGAGSVLRGERAGSFQASVPRSTGMDIVSMVAGDFNGDGRLDLTLTSANFPDTVSVLLGEGDGSFQPPARYTAASGLYSLVAGDFNGDGRLDLAAT